MILILISSDFEDSPSLFQIRQPEAESSFGFSGSRNGSEDTLDQVLCANFLSHEALNN